MGNVGEFYGLDIETDTTVDGADPMVAPIRTVALSCRRLDEVFTGVEADLLVALDERLASLPPGILATWNGATFDLPYIADRARLLGLNLSLRLCTDRRLTLCRTPLPGHAGAYRGSWGDHRHIDTFRLYGRGTSAAPWSSLRTIGRMLGLHTSSGPIDRTDDLANEARHAYASSDARLARVLAERRGQAATRMADRLAPEEAEVVAVAARRLERRSRVLQPTIAAV